MDDDAGDVLSSLLYPSKRSSSIVIVTPNDLVSVP
jgi:hypothetical protein